MTDGVTNLKRINVSSIQALSKWLEKNDDHEGSVMLVTSIREKAPRYVSREQVHNALDKHGWISTMKYTLNKSLIGHVIQKQSKHC